jgi:hypothetical protein
MCCLTLTAVGCLGLRGVARDGGDLLYRMGYSLQARPRGTRGPSIPIVTPNSVRSVVRSKPVSRRVSRCVGQLHFIPSPKWWPHPPG